MGQLSFNSSITWLVVLIFCEFVVTFIYYKSTNSQIICTRNQLSFYMGLALFFLVNFASLVLNLNSYMFDMFYDMMIWFVIPPFILIGLEHYLQRIFWNYRFRKFLLFIVKPQPAKWLFFSLFIIYISTQLPIYIYVFLKLLITISSFNMWWSMMFSSILISKKLSEKEKITHLFFNMMIMTFIMYPVYLSIQSSRNDVFQIEPSFELVIGILIFLGGYYAVCLTFIAYWFGQWSKREHVIDPINVAGWLGKSSKEDKSFNK